MNAETILRVNSIHKSFVRKIKADNGQFQEEHHATLQGVSLAVLKGKITALIGGNGAGKTTLFNIVSGFYHADSGQIQFIENQNKINIHQLRPDQIARLGIGRMFQDNHIFPAMTVLENMLIAHQNQFGENPLRALFFSKRSRKIELEQIQKAKDIFSQIFGAQNPFLEKLNDKAGTLSYGQQRLLGLARLLMGEQYQLLLLDEPTSGVSPAIIEQIKSILRYMVDEKGLTIFLIEHNMNFVLDIAHFCYFISSKMISANGTPGDILGNPAIRRDYLGL
jgi:ABC-type branched-subunit amino acid transport system ATPase component